jgi:hypothetical protein
MRAIFGTICGSAVLALGLFTLRALTWADDVKIPQTPDNLAKAMAEAGKPGPEHAKLQPLAGSWTYICKFWMDPGKPPLESRGTIERTWVLGGRFLEEKVAGTGFDGKPGFEGFGLLGYDNGRQKYTSTWACNMGTGTCNGLGVSDASGLKFTFQTEAFCPFLKKIVHSRDELRIESHDTNVLESYRIEDGKEKKVMELVAVRSG